MGQPTPTVVRRGPGHWSTLAGQLVGDRLSGCWLLHAVLVVCVGVGQYHVAHTVGVGYRGWPRHPEWDVGELRGPEVVAARHHNQRPGQHQQHQGPAGQPHHGDERVRTDLRDEGCWQGDNVICLCPATGQCYCCLRMFYNMLNMLYV